LENINFELYKVFYYVAKNRNLSKAANELFISQPAVTQSIKKLEDEIGFKLFYRTKSGMNLTKDGELLYDFLKIPIESLTSGKKYLMDETSDNSITIRIGSGATLIRFSLLPVLKSFEKDFPNVKFEIVQGITNELIEMLDNDLLDIVLLSINGKHKNDKRILIIEEAQDVFCYKKDAFNFSNKVFSMEEINQLPLLLQSKLSTSRKFLDNLASNYHVVLESRYNIASYGLVLDFLKEGLGVGFVNYNHVKDDIKKGSLVVLKTNFSIPTRQIGLCLNKKITDSSVIQKFIEYIKKN
jgi:DNA-binding transcriptional LysR family regulator